MLSVGLGSVLVQEQSTPNQGAGSTTGEHRQPHRLEASPDARTIGELLGRFVKAYNAKDAEGTW